MIRSSKSAAEAAAADEDIQNEVLEMCAHLLVEVEVLHARLQQVLDQLLERPFVGHGEQHGVVAAPEDVLLQADHAREGRFAARLVRAAEQQNLRRILPVGIHETLSNGRRVF